MQRGQPAADPLAWARRMAPGPRLIFVGLMLPILLTSLIWLGLSWHEMRWPAAAAAVYLGMLGMAEAGPLDELRRARADLVRLLTPNQQLIMLSLGHLE